MLEAERGPQEDGWERDEYEGMVTKDKMKKQD